MPRGQDDGTAVAEQRSAPRDHDLDPDLGAAPFDPGPGAGYDTKRAKRAQRRHEKAEKRLAEQRERAERDQRERERAEAIRAMQERERKETERAERERARLARAQEQHEQQLRAQEELLEKRRVERARLQAERRREAEERRERERAERERIERERKERAVALKAQERERRAERERREREEALRVKREQSLKQERERAERMHARRRQMEQPAESPVKSQGPKPEVVAAPSVAKAPPATVRAVPTHSLKRPTLKAALALAAITAAAFGAGTLLGLPLPDLGSDTGESNASLAAGSLAPLDSGTPASLTKGPFQPVRGPIDYGQKDAKFGAPRSGHMHEGQDMFAKKGTPLVAVRDGIVVDRGKVNGRYSGGRGNYLAIYSPLDDLSFVYLHLLEPAPALIGDEVKAGQQIGQMGCTGTCFGTHLHFEIRTGEARLRAETKAIDPLPYLRQWPQAPAP